MVAGIVVSFYWPVGVLGWSSCRFGVSLHHGTAFSVIKNMDYTECQQLCHVQVTGLKGAWVKLT